MSSRRVGWERGKMGKIRKNALYLAIEKALKGGSQEKRGGSRVYKVLACSRLSDSGEDTKVKGTRKVGWAGKKEKGREPPLLSPVSSRFIFVFELSQFSGPDNLGAWNRLTKHRRKARARTKGEVYIDYYPKRHLIVYYGILINCFPWPQMKLVSSPVP